MRPVSGVVLAVLFALALARPAGAQTSLVDETFTGSDVQNKNFLVGGTGFTPCLTASQDLNQKPIPGCPIGSPSLPTAGDRSGDGALRLTSNAGSLAGFVLYQDRMPFTAGLDVSFDFFAYNGSGADGFSFFLADGAVDLRRPGAPGGSLGYAQRNAELGLPGGFVGVGVDEFGNFANDGEGRGAGCSSSAGGSMWPDRVSVRGPGSGTSQYCLIRRGSALSFSLDEPNARDRDAGVRRQVRIAIDPPASANPQIVVSVGDPPAAPAEVLRAALPPNPPATFKFGFAASTGGSTNIHEVRRFVAESEIALPRLTLVKTQSGPFQSGGQGSFTLTSRAEGGANAGPVTAPVTVVDRLPAGTLAATPAGDGWDCSASAGATVSCTRPASAAAPIPAGTTLPAITVPVTFSTSTSGRFDNVAEVDSVDNANTPGQSQGTVPFRVLPVGADDAATTSVGVPVNVPILSNDLGDLDPNRVTTTRPAHGVAFWSADGRVAAYVPDPGFSGLDSFTYTVEDRSGQTLTQTVRVTVTPEAVDDEAATEFETPVTIDILANDHGSFVPTTVALVSGPASGSVTFDAQGRARYAPNAGFSGEDSFVYRVLDGAGQPATATVRVTVGPAPPPPPPPPPAAQLVVTKTAEPRAAIVGEEVTFRIVVENRGDGAAEDVRLVDAALLELEVESFRISQGSCVSGPPPTCELGTIEPGERVTITAVVRPSVPGALLNGVVVTTPTEDTRHRDNLDVAGVAVVSRAASVRVTKQADRRRVRPGGRVLFDLRVRSVRARAKRILTCDVLPRGLTFVRAPEARRVRGRRICWRAPALPRGDSLRYQVLARAGSLATARRLTNTAVVAGRNFAPQRARARVVVAADPSLRGCAARASMARVAC